MDIEDAFQVACIGVMTAIQKHNENVAGLFPSYVSIWIRQALSRYMSPYDYNVHIPIHYIERINQVIHQLPDVAEISYFKDLDHRELYSLLVEKTDCDEQEAFRIAYILSASDSVEEIIDDEQQEDCFIDVTDAIEELVSQLSNNDVLDALACLSEKERKVISLRFGFDENTPTSLEGVGAIFGVTRERVRQIEAKAKRKIVGYYFRHHLITKEQYDSVTNVDSSGNVQVKGKKQYVVVEKSKQSPRKKKHRH